MAETINTPLVDVKLPIWEMSDEEFTHFCMVNKKIRIERDKYGNIIIMPPLSPYVAHCKLEVAVELRNWQRKTGIGISCGSSTGFQLSNGAVRAFSASWTSQERWNTLTKEQKDEFLPIAPDFIIEVRSKNYSLKQLQDMIQEWMENGTRLAWLIDPKNKTTYIYRENGTSKIVKGFDKKLSGEDVAVGFELDLSLLLETL